MADIGTAYRAYLLTVSPVTDMVGDRIYTDRLLQGTQLPAIVMHDSISAISYETLEQGDGCGQRRIQVDCVAKDRADAELLRDNVRLATGTFAGTWDTIFVHGANVDGMTGGFDDPRDGSDEPRYRRIIDILVTHAETPATP